MLDAGIGHRADDDFLGAGHKILHFRDAGVFRDHHNIFKTIRRADVIEFRHVELHRR